MRFVQIYVIIHTGNPEAIAENEPGRRFEFEAFRAEALDPKNRVKVLKAIREKLLRNEALSPQEQAFCEEDEAIREIDPFFELDGLMQSVFACLEKGEATPEQAREAFNLMLKTQRKIYSLQRQERDLETD